MHWLRNLLDSDEKSSADSSLGFDWLDDPILVKIALGVAILGVLMGCLSAIGTYF